MTIFGIPPKRVKRVNHSFDLEQYIPLRLTHSIKRIEISNIVVGCDHHFDLYPDRKGGSGYTYTGSWVKLIPLVCKIKRVPSVLNTENKISYV